MDDRFVFDQRGLPNLVDSHAPSPLAGRTGYYKAVSTSPDWVVLLRVPAQGGIQEKRPRVVLAGDIGTFSLQDQIAFLGQSRWTGVLRVLSTSGERTLTLKEGEVRSAASDSPADRIGEVMIRMGYATRPQLEATLAESPPSRVGKAMVEKGYLKSHDLYKCLNEQVSEIFHNMMLAKEGTFACVDQELDEKAMVHNLSISIQGLLMDSIRKIDELAQFRKKVPHGKLYVAKKKPTDGKLEEDEDLLLGFVDGQHTVLELGLAAKVSEFDATRIVYRLLEGGYATLSQVAVTQNRPAAPPPPAPPAPVQVTTIAPKSQPVTRPPPPSNPTWPPPAVDERKVINVFNFIFREVRNEVSRRGNLDMFLASANAALRGSGVSTSRVLSGLAFEIDGSLDETLVLRQFTELKNDGHMGSEPLTSLKQALSDVMFFLLFQAGELLESRADEDLARRVKELLATIDVK